MAKRHLRAQDDADLLIDLSEAKVELGHYAEAARAARRAVAIAETDYRRAPSAARGLAGRHVPPAQRRNTDHARARLLIRAVGQLATVHRIIGRYDDAAP